MEQRRYPRIQLPLLVELKHPAVGTLRCVARDLSEGGVFVYTDNPQVRPGAKVKVSVQNALSVESQATPTVEMEVRRVEDDGLALEFSNVAGRHLWQSVEQLRGELAVGRDLFQVHLNVLVVSDSGAVLLAQQQGKWTFPATFLRVGDGWHGTLERFMLEQFGVTINGFGPIVRMHAVSHAEVPEAAVLDVFVQARAASADCRLVRGSRYKSARWADRRRQVEESTFASEQIREMADAVLREIAAEDPKG